MEGKLWGDVLPLAVLCHPGSRSWGGPRATRGTCSCLGVPDSSRVPPLPGSRPGSRARSVPDTESETARAPPHSTPRGRPRRAPAMAAAEELREEAICSICLDFFCAPVMLDCGHNFCRACISLCWARAATPSCPQCRETFPGRGLRPNRPLGNIAERLKRLDQPGGDEVRLPGGLRAPFWAVSSRCRGKAAFSTLMTPFTEALRPDVRGLGVALHAVPVLRSFLRRSAHSFLRHSLQMRFFYIPVGKLSSLWFAKAHALCKESVL